MPDTDAFPETPARPTRVVPPVAAYGLSAAMVAAAILGALIVDQVAGASNLSLIFVLPVVVAAAAFGWGPALFAAVAGMAAFNFFLIAPRGSFRVDDPANVWALGLLLVVAAIVSGVAALARARAVDAWRRADQAQALQAFAHALVGAPDRAAVAEAAAQALARAFRAPCVVLLEQDGVLASQASAGGAVLSDADLEAAGWALAARLPSHAGAYPIDRSAFDFWPVADHGRWRAVLGVGRSGAAADRPSDPQGLMETVGAYLSVALAREAYAAEVLDGRVAAAGQRLKADLLAAVSHDLKTPLSTILITLQSLVRFADVHDAQTRAELLRLAIVETERLSGLVANLLDMSRLEAGAVAVTPSAALPVTIATVARRHAATALSGHTVIEEVAVDAPALLVDPALSETALANILENAGKYAPPGSQVRIRFFAEDGAGVFEVTDQGPGFHGSAEPLFEKFARGVQGDGRAPGTGLGLSIARGFAEAQGGRVEAADRDDAPGACVRLILPLAPHLVVA
ncbi:DUF4118 domain-containing protein [Phenylobacterium sp.]|uniref:sensor histidine kinase n=1 Tax=Phenylobacterium sp. TaxID=1871053 RepID=UPI002733B48E|nr:DUF4118 domain-containing protein [Phenylobacterium sp.]MDP3658655.1 DUF4118 domain-containing protein [Phenylobacterium sp.]